MNCSFLNSPGVRTLISRLVFVAGLLLYLAVQGVLTISPLANWDLFPEPDDGLTYVLKTKQMEECFRQDCPALNDLRQQLLVPAADPQATRQQFLAASKIFPVYHPLFSLIMLVLAKFGLSLMAAYRLLWCLGPLIFASAFAYLLAALFGLPVAGLSLALLAFKVFPDTGLHHVVPSNLTMALAVVVWARLITRRGDAPVTLVIGSLALVAMHPIGRLYSLMAAGLALWLAGLPGRVRPRLWAAALAAGLIVALAFVIPELVTRPMLKIFNPAVAPQGGSLLLGILKGAAQSLEQIVVDLIRLELGLFGLMPFFCGAVILGLVALPPERRPAVLKFLGINLLFLAAIFFYVSSHPADVFFRMWIPLVVVLFGLVGQGLWYALGQTRCWLEQRRQEPETALSSGFPGAWPPVLLAVLLGYVLHMMVMGGEQVYTTARFVRERQPLTFSPAQVELLLSQARPEDRVLYTSYIIMPYYFIHGAMRQGAVYYQPAFRGLAVENTWLNRPDLRFAVAYNPLVYHPSFEGVEEHRWWITSPDFHYSPLNNPRRHGPLAKEGKIAAAEFLGLDVAFQDREISGPLRVLIDNPSQASEIAWASVDQEGKLLAPRLTAPIPAGWSGWLELSLKELPRTGTYRLLFPLGNPRYAVGGLTSSQERLLWPWARKAKVTLLPRSAGSGAITVSFDPADLLPAPLRHRPVRVLDDHGSSVLLRLD